MSKAKVGASTPRPAYVGEAEAMQGRARADFGRRPAPKLHCKITVRARIEWVVCSILRLFCLSALFRITFIVPYESASYFLTICLTIYDTMGILNCRCGHTLLRVIAFIIIKFINKVL